MSVGEYATALTAIIYNQQKSLDLHSTVGYFHGGPSFPAVLVSAFNGGKYAMGWSSSIEINSFRPLMRLVSALMGKEHQH